MACSAACTHAASGQTRSRTPCPASTELRSRTASTAQLPASRTTRSCARCQVVRLMSSLNSLPSPFHLSPISLRSRPSTARVPMWLLQTSYPHATRSAAASGTPDPVASATTFTTPARTSASGSPQSAWRPILVHLSPQLVRVHTLYR